MGLHNVSLIWVPLFQGLTCIDISIVVSVCYLWWFEWLCLYQYTVLSVWCSSASPTLRLAVYRISCRAIMSGPVENRQCNVVLRRVGLRNAVATAAGEAWQKGRTNYVVRPRESSCMVALCTSRLAALRHSHLWKRWKNWPGFARSSYLGHWTTFRIGQWVVRAW